jgi:hypothetical protein
MVHSADSLRVVDIKMDDSDLMKKRRGIQVLTSAVGDIMDGSKASPTGGDTRHGGTDRGLPEHGGQGAPMHQT